MRLAERCQFYPGVMRHRVEALGVSEATPAAVEPASPHRPVSGASGWRPARAVGEYVVDGSRNALRADPLFSQFMT